MERKEAEPISVPVDKPSTVNDINDAMMQIGRFGDGRIKKMEVDYTAEVDKQIPEANLKARVCFFSLTLFYLSKQTGGQSARGHRIPSTT